MRAGLKDSTEDLIRLEATLDYRLAISHFTRSLVEALGVSSDGASADTSGDSFSEYDDHTWHANATPEKRETACLAWREIVRSGVILPPPPMAVPRSWAKPEHFLAALAADRGIPVAKIGSMRHDALLYVTTVGESHDDTSKGSSVAGPRQGLPFLTALSGREANWFNFEFRDC